jgi:hypothetical protein
MARRDERTCKQDHRRIANYRAPRFLLIETGNFEMEINNRWDFVYSVASKKHLLDPLIDLTRSPLVSPRAKELGDRFRARR